MNDTALMLTEDDRTRLRELAEALHDARFASLLTAYYRDADRADRTPRSLLYLHLGQCTGVITRLLESTAAQVDLLTRYAALSAARQLLVDDLVRHLGENPTTAPGTDEGGCPQCGSNLLRDKGSFDKCMNCGYRITADDEEASASE